MDWVTTVDALVRARAEDDRPGLLFEGRSWTYREYVAEAAARAAWYESVRPDGAPPHVGVLLENVPEYAFWLAAAALGQEWMKESAIIIVIAAIYDRATRKYGQRGIRYAHMEVGHAAQNVYLQAGSLNLGTTLVGAFDDKRVKEVLKLPSDEQPLGLMPIGGR